MDNPSPSKSFIRRMALGALFSQIFKIGFGGQGGGNSNRYSPSYSNVFMSGTPKNRSSRPKKQFHRQKKKRGKRK
jgi:hypothetical protein